jgi:nitrate/TMAO reductase-like tetraheme cytochrome c subunit
MQKVVDKKTGETCIECHKGIAHKLPEGYDDDDD